MSLTEMLQKEQEITMQLGEMETMVARKIFADWLSKVELPTYHTLTINATEAIRELLVTLVNEL
ncbi:hypothetical protein LCGC14_0383550 [marine sediment metagenome]|uniref:Uncharacterized protein n=1 Tax=marine sediment metagenome TaxID=412755 RepID=A0A0F9VNY5_9ZZZZ